jgi:uncharacterized protein YggE
VGVFAMKGKNNSIAITVIISIVVLLMFFVLAFRLPFLKSSNEATVMVQGVSTVSVMPDLITVYFSVVSSGDDAVDARNKNSKILNDLIDNLLLEGFSRDKIVTENFNVRQDYIWEDGKRIENGFVATHSVKIELSVNDSEIISIVVDSGINAGALVNYINFGLTQESQNKYKAESMKLAAEDAKVKAESVALGLGKSVGKILYVEILDFGYRPWVFYEADMKSGVEIESSNIQVGEEEIFSTVSATFELK